MDSTLPDSRRWLVCSGGQWPMANIATDCEVALHVSDFMPGRILLRCKLRPRSPGTGLSSLEKLALISDTMRCCHCWGSDIESCGCCCLAATSAAGTNTAAICAGTAAGAAAAAAAGTAAPLLALAPPVLKRFIGRRTATHRSHA